ncbi:MAG: aromatic acid/H+ symport family MFS transporter [Gracilibacteraceae bacterium]|jgi:AAHS family benzoate transporter-like MFS transporter|nr:aromatic acid/H+ symport family MFS transporter [Gracilibacteraceae bacterium]
MKVNKAAVFILCFFITTGEGYNLFLYGAVLPLLKAEWSLSPSQAGFIGSSSLVGMMLGSILLGVMADKVGRQKTLLLSVALYSLFTFLGGFAHSALAFTVYRFLCGIGIGGALPNVTALAADYAPPRLRNTLVAVVLCGIQFGGLLGPAVGIFTAQRFGWRAVLFFGGVTVILLPFMWKYIPKQGPADMSGPANQGGEERANIFRTGHPRNNIMFWLAYFMTLLMIYGLGTWLPELMMRGGASLNGSLVFPIILNVGCIIGTFILATLADKWIKPRILLIILYLAGALSLAALGWGHSIPALGAIIFVTGACTYGTQNIANAYVSQYYPPAIRSTGLGWCNGVGRLGAVFGTAFWGFLLEWELSQPVIFLVFAVPALLAGLAFGLVKES